MASTPGSGGDSGSVSNAGQYAVDLRSIEERYAQLMEQYSRLLERWKDEQQMRLRLEQQVSELQTRHGTLKGYVLRLESRLREFQSAAQQLRALL